MAKHQHETESEFTGHEPCPECGSKDNLARYDDGHGYCFGCGYHEQGESDVEGDDHGVPGRRSDRLDDRADNNGGGVASRSRGVMIDPGSVRALKARGISAETCEFFGYTVSKFKGKVAQVASYCDERRRPVAQKVRTQGKDFVVFGDLKAATPLYGQWLWRQYGKMIVITEGEIDCLSVSQMQGNRWPVVSVPTGAKGALKAIKRSVEWLEQFEQVIFMFDMDEPGMEAAEECAKLLSPGKAKIASLPLKDANEMLLAGRGAEIIDAIWGAKSYRPDGLVTVGDLKEEALRPAEYGIPWPWPTLTKLTYGRRRGEVYTFGAGTGIGKTDVFTQIVAQTISELNLPVAMFYLEQPPVETVRRVCGKLAGQRFHIPDAGWTEAQLMETWGQLEDAGKLFLYDHFGETDWDVIQQKIRFLAISEGVKDFFVDHLTAMADPENERESLELLMKDLATVAQELGITIYLISHLATPEGKPHEEGGRVMIRHFKGSRSIGFWSHFMFGLERNQQSEDEFERKTTTFRVLKDRYTGTSTGETFLLGYDVPTGMLHETEAPDEPSFQDETGGDY